VPEGNPCRIADRFKCGQAHDGSATTGPNDWLAKKFDEMHDMYQGAQHKNDFQVRGYQKGMSIFFMDIYELY
jgi:DNA polymerase lambda